MSRAGPYDWENTILLVDTVKDGIALYEDTVMKMTPNLVFSPRTSASVSRLVIYDKNFLQSISCGSFHLPFETGNFKTLKSREK